MSIETLTKPTNDLAEMSQIATKAVKWYRKHLEACDQMPLTYIDKLLDALLAGKTGLTIRDAVTDLLDMVPDLSQAQAFSLAQTKFLGIGLDDDLA